jgi:hypothetical protein
VRQKRYGRIFVTDELAGAWEEANADILRKHFNTRRGDNKAGNVRLK